MNPIAFCLSVVIVAFLFPMFRHMIADCYDSAYRQSSGPLGSKVDMVFNMVLGLGLALSFGVLCFSVLWVGVQPLAFFR